MSGGCGVAVLVSGEGTNLQALLDDVHGRVGVEVRAVAASKPAIPALARAESAAVEARVFARSDFDGDRVARDLALADWLTSYSVDLVVTAGWMELLSPEFLARFPERVVNVHPSLLPAFPGIDAVGQALAAGVSETGVTVHLVDDGVDTGAVLLQQAVPLPPGCTRDQALALLRPVEHRLLPEAVRLLAAGPLA